MKLITTVFLLAAILMAGALSIRAQTNSEPVVPMTAEEKQQASLNKHIKPIMDAFVNLNDATKEAEVRGALSEFFIAHAAWHQTNDAALKSLWNDFNHARAKQDKAGADKALAEIDGVYATFKPQHDKLVSSLATVLSPEQDCHS